MKQQTLATAADQGSGYEQYRKPTRREEFLKSFPTLRAGQAFMEKPVTGLRNLRHMR